MEILDKFQIVGLKNILPDEVNKLIFKFHKVHPTAGILKPWIDEYIQYELEEEPPANWFPRSMLKDSQYWYGLTVMCRRCGEAISERDSDNNDYMCVDCFFF